MTTSAEMQQSIEDFLVKATAHITPIVFDIDIALPAGGTKAYDLKTIVTAHALYELRSARITVLIKDTTAGAPTLNKYINAESLIVAGIDAAGLVTVHNPSTIAATAIIRIDHPSIRK